MSGVGNMKEAMQISQLKFLYGEYIIPDCVENINNDIYLNISVH